MEGVFDSVTRGIYSEIGGYDQFVTEFVRVSAHVLPRRVFVKYAPELENGGKTSSGDLVYVQLLGSDYERMAANAVKAVDFGAPGIDINFGCPAKRVNHHEGGAKLLVDPSNMEGLVRSIVEAVGDRVPVTAKVRLGYENKDQCVDIAKAVENGGAQKITVHARTKLEGYKPPAHWQYIAKMKRAISIPTVANGDIWTVEDAIRCQEVSECEDLALGRPAFANPGLALDIKRHLSGEKEAPPAVTWQEMYDHWLPIFIDRSRRIRHDAFALQRTKQWTKMMGAHFPESQKLFENIKRFQSLEELAQFLPCLLSPNSL